MHPTFLAFLNKTSIRVFHGSCLLIDCFLAAGIISGVTGASGNLGGIVFAIIFRFNGKQYGKVYWIIGIMTMAINLAVCWIRPIPKGQIGGH